MASDAPIPEFTIIGASPAGYTFALSLLRHRPDLHPSQLLIIETNAEGRRPGGPFFLTPNSLRLLDRFRFGDDRIHGPSIYDQIRAVGYNLTHHTIRNEHGVFLGAFDKGQVARWGYNGLRIERGVILGIMEAEIRRLGVRVEYDTSFREVVSETTTTTTTTGAEGGVVEFRVRERRPGAGGDGGTDDHFTIRRTRRLIGADGVHSRVRTYVCGREVAPAYTGNVMAAAYIPRARVEYEGAWEVVRRQREDSISVTGPRGTVMAIPADHEANVLQLGRQWATPELDRKGWAALHADKKALLAKFTEDRERWAGMPRSMLDAIREEDVWGVWPFYLLPKLECWVSEQGKAVIIGDAAHTLIPAAAQGANQAFEDAWTLAKAYSSVAGGRDVDEAQAVRAWEQKRMKKLERVSKLSVQLMNVRLPPEEQAKLPPDMIFDLAGNEEDRRQRLDWLYGEEDEDLAG